MVKITYLIKSLKSLISDYAMLFPKSVAFYPRLGRQSGILKKYLSVSTTGSKVREICVRNPASSVSLSKLLIFSYLFSGEKKSLLCRIVRKLENIYIKC